MPKYVIERSIPGAGKLSDAEFAAIATKSSGIMADMGPRIQWLHSYVTDDKVYCVYIADSVETVLEHSRRGELPVDSVNRVARMIDPTTAEAPALIGA